MAQGLFDLTPEDAIAQQNAMEDKSASNFADMNPYQRANYMLYKAGSGLGNLGAGMLGMVNPQVEQAKKLQAAQQGIDMSTPEGLKELARRLNSIGMGQHAMSAVTAARDLELKQAQTQQALAHARYFDNPKQNNTDEKLAGLKAIEYRVAIKDGINGGLSGNDLEAYAQKRVNDLEQRYNSTIGKSTISTGQNVRPIEQIPNPGNQQKIQIGDNTAIVSGTKFTQEDKDRAIADAASRNDLKAVEELKNMPTIPTNSPQLKGKEEMAANIAAATTKARESAKPQIPDISPETVDFYAKQSLSGDNSWQVGLARGKVGQQLISAVKDRIPNLATELNISPEEAAANKNMRVSNGAALTQITKDISAITPYHDMLNTNAEVAKQLAAKISSTDSRLLNKPINWLRTNAANNVDVAEYLAQIHILTTEASRVLNNPRLVGQLTDSARKDMQEIISGDMPLSMSIRIINRLQSDGNNRVNAMQEQAKSLKSNLGSPVGNTTSNRQSLRSKYNLE